MKSIQITNSNIAETYIDYTEAIKISFSDDLNVNDIQQFIVKNQINRNIQFDIKTLNFEFKKTLFSNWFSNYEIVNPSILTNIITLIRAYNDFADDFFESDIIYFNSITEFLDIKLELKEEIDNFVNDFSTWYYSLFKCIHKVEINFLETFKPMPNIFGKMITSLDFITISGIISKATDVDFKNLYLVENALTYISVLSQKISLMNMFMNKFNIE